MRIIDEQHGKGTLSLDNGDRVTGTFHVQQFQDGSIHLNITGDHPFDGFRLMAAPISEFAGTTTEDDHVRTQGPLHFTQINGRYATIIVSQLTIRQQQQATVVVHEYLLTNLLFPGTRLGTTPSPVQLRIPHANTILPVTLSPHDEYPMAEAILRHQCHPTPTASLRLTASEDETAVDMIVEQFLNALSIVQGHKISWITHDAIDENNTVISQRRRNTVTKRISGLALNRQHNKDERLPLTAVQDCYARCVELEQRYSWRGRVLETWLEARTDADYVENRALKIVVVIEALRAVVIPKHPPHKITTFRQDIALALRLLGVSEHSRAIELFVKCRNKLIHEGQCRCNAEPASVAQEADAPKTPFEEYVFLTSFVDRVIMQSVGLSHHIRPSTPQRASSTP